MTALSLPYNNSKLHKTSDCWSKDMHNFNFSEKGLGLVSPTHFVYDFLRKMFLMLHSINWPDFIAFISQEIGQYVYCNCLLTSQWGHKIWNWPYLFNQAVLRHEQKVNAKTGKWEWEELLRWNKKHFLSFLKSFQLPKIVSDLREHL